MNDQNERHLRKNYPLLFRSDFWGVMCWDGWFSIIDALCWQLTEPVRQLENDLNKMKSCRAKLPKDQTKWTREQKKMYGEVAFESMKNDLRKARRAVPVVVQIKEKFGHLRFSTRRAKETDKALISMAERLALKTCDICGAPGELIEDGWHRVRCEKHRRIVEQPESPLRDKSVFDMLKLERYRCERVVNRILLAIEELPDGDTKDKLQGDILANRIRIATLNDIMSLAED